MSLDRAFDRSTYAALALLGMAAWAFGLAGVLAAAALVAAVGLVADRLRHYALGSSWMFVGLFVLAAVPLFLLVDSLV